MSEGRDSKLRTHQESLESESQEALLPVTTTTSSISTAGASEQADMRVTEKGERNLDGIAGIAALCAVGILAAITWFIVLTNNPTSLGWFALHPLLQTLSLVLFTYGILTLQPTSQANPKAKAAGLNRHQFAVFLLGFPAILVGTWAVWHNKNLRGAEHYTTWHGTFGGLCLLWMFGQIILGAGSVWFDGKLFGGGAKAKSLWKYHRLSGYILFPLMLLTAHFGGAWSLWGERNAAWIVRFLAYTIAPILILGGVLVRVRTSKMKFW